MWTTCTKSGRTPFSEVAEGEGVYIYGEVLRVAFGIDSLPDHFIVCHFDDLVGLTFRPPIPCQNRNNDNP